MRDRRVLAAALWVVLAFLVWNVRFDYGVRVSAKAYLTHRALFLRGAEPNIEMAATMRVGIRDSARAATVIALPLAGLAVWLAATRWRRFNETPQS